MTPATAMMIARKTENKNPVSMTFFIFSLSPAPKYRETRTLAPSEIPIERAIKRKLI